MVEVIVLTLVLFAGSLVAGLWLLLQAQDRSQRRTADLLSSTVQSTARSVSETTRDALAAVLAPVTPQPADEDKEPDPTDQLFRGAYERWNPIVRDPLDEPEPAA